jgi:glucan biosynthesis protein
MQNSRFHGLKFFLVLSAILLLAQWAAVAQSKKSFKSVESRSAYFTKEITDYVTRVDSVQAKQILDINIEVTRKFDSLKGKDLPSEEYRPAAAAIYRERDAAIKKVLSAFQYDEYMMLQAEKKKAYIDKKKAKEAAADSAVKGQ